MSKVKKTVERSVLIGVCESLGVNPAEVNRIVIRPGRVTVERNFTVVADSTEETDG